MKQSHWDELRKLFRQIEGIPSDWQTHEFYIFFEVEALLYLYENLVPESEKRNVKNTWALVSGFYVPESLANQVNAKELILNARERIRYVKVASAWSYWLRQYKSYPAEIRLFTFPELGKFEQATGVRLRPERLQHYEEFLFGKAKIATSIERPIANQGTYTFEIDKQEHSISFPTAMPIPLKQESSELRFQIKANKEGIEVDLLALGKSAKELDIKEAELNLLHPHDWFRRLEPLLFKIKDKDGNVQKSYKIRIEGLFHLVGALGIGKSTIISLLVYHLACIENRHVSIVMNTVVEAYQMARWLRLMGIKATPALGTNRADHARKVGYANQEIFNPQSVFSNPDENEPFFRWLPKPCGLNALSPEIIPLGQEPCRRLKDKDGKYHECPLLDTCAVHQVNRDLLDSQVWLLNPASFLYSRLPRQGSKQSPSLLEAVYQISDLLIIDEADRVQAGWDKAFAPSSIALGTNDAFLDWFHRQMFLKTTGANRNYISRPIIQRLTKLDDQSNTLANQAYSLLNYGRKKALPEWIEHRQLSNEALFSGLLINTLKKKFPRGMSEAEQKVRETALLEECKTYWKNPLNRENGFLAEWLNEFLGSDKLDKQLRQNLANWLREKMGWVNKPKGFVLLCRKLELVIVLSALIKRLNDINHHFALVEDEFEEYPSRNPRIPDALLEIMPEAPLGKVLGLRLISSPKNNERSFHVMQYYGVGRWLLHNFHRLFVDKTGISGPNVLLTSATSWLPESASFHLAQEPEAILSRRETPKPTIELRFKPVMVDGKALRVSGAKSKENNLRRIAQALALSQGNNPSDLERELGYWKKQGEQRRILLVVNSYEQANIVVDELEKIPTWHGRSLRLFPDDSELREFGIRTREVESFHKHEADILIAPLMAIQRGFNILDELGDALLGTGYFLVRPFTPPDDLSPQITSLNKWFMEQLAEDGRSLEQGYGETLDAISTMRSKAYKQWSRRLKARGFLASFDEDLYQEFLRDSFITVWQTVGRLIRNGRSARVYFVDDAFLDSKSKRKILHDWHAMLKSLFETESLFEKELASELYLLAWQAFEKAMNERRF